MFPDPVRPVQSQEAHLLIQGLKVAAGETEMSCWPSPGNEMRDMTWGRWLVQAKTREWIMTKTPSEAEDLVEIVACQHLPW